MLFLTSVSFAALFPLLWLLALAIAAVSPLPKPITVAGFYGTSYLLLLGILRAVREHFADTSFRNAPTRRKLDGWLSVRGCEWLNITGVATVGSGAAILFVAGLLPFHLWFLFTAIVLGCADLMRKDRLVTLPGCVPEPRSELDLDHEIADEDGKRCKFSWMPWTRRLRDTACQTEFIISHEEYRGAQNQSRSSADDLREYARCVRDGCGGAVKDVAAFFRFRSGSLGLTVVQDMEDVVCFKRGIPLTSALSSTQKNHGREKFPVETLYEQAGSCEDHAILVAAVLFSLGHDVTLFWLRLKSGVGHLALGFHAEGLIAGGMSEMLEGKRYFYVETIPTAVNQGPGDIGTELLTELESVEVVPV